MGGGNYDFRKRSRAYTAAALRAAVALYLIRLGWNILSNTNTSMEPLTAKLTGGAFIAAALLFGIYILRQLGRDLKDAELPGNDETPETQIFCFKKRPTALSLEE